jgi:hypothetical protein
MKVFKRVVTKVAKMPFDHLILDINWLRNLIWHWKLLLKSYEIIYLHVQKRFLKCYEPRLTSFFFFPKLVEQVFFHFLFFKPHSYQ